MVKKNSMSNLEKEDRRVYEPRLHNPKTDRVIIYNDRESEIAYLSSKRILTTWKSKQPIFIEKYGKP